MYVVFPMFIDEQDNDAWLRGYLLMAGVVAIAFLIIAFSKFNVPVSQKSSSIKQDISEMLKLFKRPLVWIFALFAFFYVMTEQGIMTWLPTFNKETLNIDPRLASQVAVILMTSIALGRFVSGILVKKIKWVYLTFAGVIGAAILVLIVLPMAGNVSGTRVSEIANLPLAAYLFPMIGFFLAPLYPLVSSTVLSNTEKEMQSPLAGILVFSSAIGGTLGSLIIGFLFDSIGGSKVFYLSLVPMVIIFVLLFSLNRLSSKSA